MLPASNAGEFFSARGILVGMAEPKAIAFHAGTGLEPVEAATANDGVPERVYLKDLLRVGRYVKTSTGQTIDITPEKLELYNRSTNDFLAAGHAAPITNMHDHSGDPDHARGALLGTFIDGDRLMGRIKLVGQKAIEAARKAGVSIYSPGRVQATDGKWYDAPIKHVALTTSPVVHGQGPFIEAGEGSDPDPGEPFTPAEEQTMKLSADTLKALELSDAAKPEDTEAAIVAALAKRDEKINTLNGQVDALKAELADKPAKVELSNTERSLSKRALKSELESLVQGGHIVPAVADELAAKLSDDAYLVVPDGSEDPRFASILEPLRKNDAVKLAEQTGPQRKVALSDARRDGLTDDDIEAEIQRRIGKK